MIWEFVPNVVAIFELVPKFRRAKFRLIQFRTFPISPSLVPLVSLWSAPIDARHQVQGSDLSLNSPSPATGSPLVAGLPQGR